MVRGHKHIEILTDEAKERLSELPLVLRTGAKMLIDGLQSIFGGNCNEDEVASLVVRAETNARGKYSDDELMTYDEASRTLGIKNRNKLRATLTKFGVEQHTLTNHKCGFPREQVLIVRNKLLTSKMVD